eukprot:TRINITY_DN1900_c0_g1_i1.p1 TRINITY_DN1900_c0_g1~~TRINITY_DN1900_c0_g1_i1.p1  ORF type:complete len:783 (+),score=126.10 TRINITY_DN1900_c0_g1_i1:35-2383(+)
MSTPPSLISGTTDYSIQGSSQPSSRYAVPSLSLDPTFEDAPLLSSSRPISRVPSRDPISLQHMATPMRPPHMRERSDGGIITDSETESIGGSQRYTREGDFEYRRESEGRGANLYSQYHKSRNACASLYTVPIEFVVLFITSWSLMSLMVVDSMVAAAEIELAEQEGYSSIQLGLLYQGSAGAAFVFALVMGFLSHYISARAAGLVASIFILFGCVVFIVSDSFLLKIGGRLLVGVGLGPAELLTDIIIVRWFDPSEDGVTLSMELAFGVVSAAGMLGGAIGLNIVPLSLDFVRDTLVDYVPAADSLLVALLFVAFIPLFTFILFCIFYVLDMYATPHLDLELDEDEDTSVRAAWKSLKSPFWILFLVLTLNYASIFILILFGPDYLQENWDYNSTDASRGTSLIYLGGVVGSFLSGLVVSRFGHLVTLLGGGSILGAGGCLLLLLAPLPPYLGLSAIGLALGIMECCIWTGVGVVVPESASGIAFGLLTANLCGSLSLYPYPAGYYHETFGNYNIIPLYITLSTTVTLVGCGLLLWLAPGLQSPTAGGRYLYFIGVKMQRKKRFTIAPSRRRHSLGSLMEVEEILDKVDTDDELKLLYPEALPDGSISNLHRYFEKSLARKDADEAPDSVNLLEAHNDVAGEILEDLVERSYTTLEDATGFAPSRSLPGNYFSQLVEMSLDMEPVNLDELDSDEDQFVDTVDVKQVKDSDDPDFVRIWSEIDGSEAITVPSPSGGRAVESAALRGGSLGVRGSSLGPEIDGVLRASGDPGDAFPVFSSTFH